MPPIPKRHRSRDFIFPADLLEIYPLSIYSARRWMRAIRKAHNLPDGTYITIDLFCKVKGLDREFVLSRIVPAFLAWFLLPLHTHLNYSILHY